MLRATALAWDAERFVRSQINLETLLIHVQFGSRPIDLIPRLNRSGDCAVPESEFLR